MSTTTPGRDEQRLAELGYSQDLNRAWSGFSNFAISFTIISILAGCFTTYGQAWNNGGPIAISIGWPLISCMILLVAFCMSELVSAYPTAGGIYWWASELGGAAWGWFTGWFNLVGLVAVVASVDYGCATFISALLNLWSVDLGIVKRRGKLDCGRRPLLRIGGESRFKCVRERVDVRAVGLQLTECFARIAAVISMPDQQLEGHGGDRVDVVGERRFAQANARVSQSLGETETGYAGALRRKDDVARPDRAVMDSGGCGIVDRLGHFSDPRGHLGQRTWPVPSQVFVD